MDDKLLQLLGESASERLNDALKRFVEDMHRQREDEEDDDDA